MPKPTSRTPHAQLCAVQAVELKAGERKQVSLEIDRFWLQAVLPDGTRVSPDGKTTLHIGGWPNAWAAFRKAKEVYAEEDGAYGGMFGLGEPNTAYAKYFVGNSYLKPLTDPKKTVFLANVTFEPKCRNNWHIHHATSGGGQILLCVDGNGWYQKEGKAARALHPGDVISIPVNVKHWHGAAKDSWFSHIAIECPGENTHTEWCDAVSNETYAACEET